MELKDKGSLIDILNASESILSFTKDTTETNFYKSDLIQSAVIRKLEIIGEATKRLSKEFRANNNDLPWSKMAGLRDILIHAYDGVDISELWNIIQTEIKNVQKEILKIRQINEF